jgi:CheY-like chemotaxis protein
MAGERERKSGAVVARCFSFAQEEAVALTGYAQPEDAARARAAGYQAHAAKPIEPTVLVLTVSGAVRQPNQP